MAFDNISDDFLHHLKLVLPKLMQDPMTYFDDRQYGQYNFMSIMQI